MLPFAGSRSTSCSRSSSAWSGGAASAAVMLLTRSTLDDSTADARSGRR